MNQQSNADAPELIVVLLVILISAALYFLYCYCFKLICQKCGHEPGILVWIPIANIIPLLTVAKMPVWLIILFFVPLVNAVLALVMWYKVTEARGKPGWLALLLLVPFLNAFYVPYLAFSD